MHIDCAKENLLNWKVMILLEMINSFVLSDCFYNKQSCVWTWLKNNFDVAMTSREFVFEDFYDIVVQKDNIDDIVVQYGDRIILHESVFYNNGWDRYIKISIPTALVEHIVEVKEQIQEEFQHLCSKHEAAIQITVPKTRDERYRLYQTLKKEFEESE